MISRRIKRFDVETLLNQPFLMVTFFPSPSLAISLSSIVFQEDAFYSNTIRVFVSLSESLLLAQNKSFFKCSEGLMRTVMPRQQFCM